VDREDNTHCKKTHHVAAEASRRLRSGNGSLDIKKFIYKILIAIRTKNVLGVKTSRILGRMGDDDDDSEEVLGGGDEDDEMDFWEEMDGDEMLDGYLDSGDPENFDELVDEAMDDLEEGELEEREEIDDLMSELDEDIDSIYTAHESLALHVNLQSKQTSLNPAKASAKETAITPYTYCKSFSSGICQCFPHYSPPPNKYIKSCTQETKTPSLKNCLESKENSPKKCGLCKPGYILHTDQALCKKGACQRGCKLCTQKNCLVTQKTYMFNGHTTCLIKVRDGRQKDRIIGCQAYRTDGTCYECIDGEVVSG
jgi:hypothetical protein